MSDGRGRRAGALFCPVLLALCAATAWGAPLRDPTRPFAAGGPGAGPPAAVQRSLPRTPPPSPPQAAPRLSAIVFGEGRRLAVIDGRAVAEGERSGTAEVVRIEADRVVVRRDGKEMTLHLVAPVHKSSPP